MRKGEVYTSPIAPIKDIKSVKIPYHNGTIYKSSMTGANDFTAKVFSFCKRT